MAGDRSEPPVTTDEDLARVTVGEVRLLDGPVTLAEYDPAWPERYAALAREIAEALDEAAVLIEHVGSTSVPGLVAKPIIDIVLVVADSAHEAEYVAPLEALGYALRIREPDWYEHGCSAAAARGGSSETTGESLAISARWVSRFGLRSSE